MSTQNTLQSDPDSLPDQTLLNLIQRRSQDESQAAMSVIYQRYAKDVWGFIYSKVQQRDIVEDITSPYLPISPPAPPSPHPHIDTTTSPAPSTQRSMQRHRFRACPCGVAPHPAAVRGCRGCRRRSIGWMRIR